MVGNSNVMPVIVKSCTSSGNVFLYREPGVFVYLHERAPKKRAPMIRYFLASSIAVSCDVHENIERKLDVVMEPRRQWLRSDVKEK